MLRKLIVLIALGLMSSAGWAATITVIGINEGVSPAEVVTITAAGTGITNLPVYAGVYNWGASGGITGDIHTFCMEMQYDAGTEHWTVGNLEDGPDPGTGMVRYGNGMGSVKADLIRQLWARDYSPSLLNDSVSAAAFQVAIWRIEYGYDGTLSHLADLSSGTFTASGGANVINQASTWLGQLTSTYANKETHLVALIDPDAQDYVYYSPPTSHSGMPPGVPLPSALWAGAALMGLIMLHRAFPAAA